MSCGCGDGTHGWWCDERVATTPLPVSNRPGLPVIRRRVATHATAKATMLQALSRPGLIALHELTRRTDDDFSVALLDTAATAVDIVTFYTDRHVNEQYLRTATEQRSVAALARLIGYAPQPAIAPTVDLAFTLETAPGAPVRTRVPVGTAVQSNPEPGQPPAVYETLHDLDASPAWNALRPRARRRHGAPGTRVSLAGTVTGIAAGDGVLFRAGPGDRSVTFALVSKVTNVDAVPALPGVPGSPPRTELEISPVGTKNADPSVEPLPSTGTLPGMPASVEWIDEPSLSAAALDAGLLARSLDIDDIVAPLAAPSGSPGQVALFRQQRALAGSQAPPSSSIAATIALASALPNVPANIYSWAKPLILPWEAATADHYKSIGAAGDVYLDGASPGVPAGSLVVLRSDDKWAAYAVTKAAAESVTVFATTGRCIRLSLTPKTGLGEFSVRRTTAYAAPEYFALADVPVVEPLTSATIELDGLQLGLREGRPVVLSGSPVADPGHNVRISTTLAAVTHNFGERSTSVTLGAFPPGGLARTGTVVAANVVRASQGETRREVLGSGDGRAVFQRFELRQPPLTYLSAPTASGLASTLEVRVDGALWSEVPSFQDSGPSDTVYVVRHENGVSVLQFGDGLTGARLPTGQANVRATYRTGAGIAGRVNPGQLSMPMSRAGGVTGVTNYAGSEGGDDAETLSSARTSAPLRVTTVDRVVSLADYTAFSRAFPGIAKAQAVVARSAPKRGVLVTVADRTGEPIRPDSGVGANLLTALRTFGDPLVPVAITPHVPRSFRLAVDLRAAAELQRSDVLGAVTARLREVFSFAARDLGQPVASSEVLAEIQGVRGVVAATVRAFWIVEPNAQEPPDAPPPEILSARTLAPGSDINTREGSDLLVLDSAAIRWGILS